MLKYALIGAGLAFAAVVQPGPLQAFLLSRVASAGWRRTLPAAVSPLLSDGPIALVALVVLHRLATGFEIGLRTAGGVLLLYFAWTAFCQWRKEAEGNLTDPASVPKTLMQAVVVNVVNPSPYIGWSLILGPMVIAAWKEAPAHAVVLVAVFYATMVLGLVLFILALGTTSYLGPAGRRWLQLASAFALAAIGAYQLITAYRGVMTG